MRAIIALGLVAFVSCAASMAAAAAPRVDQRAGDETAVYIVYVDRPESADPEDFHLRTLRGAVGSEDAAKEAVLYHYKTAASGFSAKLTLSQVEELKKQPGVLQVVPSQSYQLHGTGAHVGFSGGRI